MWVKKYIQSKADTDTKWDLEGKSTGVTDTEEIHSSLSLFHSPAGTGQKLNRKKTNQTKQTKKPRSKPSILISGFSHLSSSDIVFQMLKFLSKSVVLMS